MNLLLDTHVLLWIAADSPRLDERARERLRQSRIFLSTASSYEIALKHRLGRLPGGGAVLDGWERLVRGLRAEEVALSTHHMRRAGDMDWGHRDPFDRLLVAQAQIEGLVLMTDDAAINGFPEVRSQRL